MASVRRGNQIIDELSENQKNLSVPALSFLECGNACRIQPTVPRARKSRPDRPDLCAGLLTEFFGGRDRCGLGPSFVRHAT